MEDNTFINVSKDMMSFIEKSPTAFHVTANFMDLLDDAGFVRLNERDRWHLISGGKYYATRNDSSIIAFRMPATEGFANYQIAAAHSDSPSFKVKENPELTPDKNYVSLNVEKYGGMLMGTWFDRPLSVAGRIIVERDGKLEARLVDVDRDLMIIPSVAIHMNRAANDGVKLLANVDTFPLLGCGAQDLRAIVAEAAGVATEQILGHDLFLYLRGRGSVLGAEGELIGSPKLDDLACAFALTEGFLQSSPSGAIPVLAVFDNEEVGSETKQGAASNFLRDTLRRLTLALGKTEEDYLRWCAGSFLVSADNAHAQHPNHPEFADAQNTPYLNGGVVVKFNANQRYATDAVSAAAFRLLCRETGEQTQTYANRSDLPGGSTLGSISDTRVAVPTVDIGLAQLAMHSAYETMGARDLDSLVRVMTAYFGRTPRRNAGAMQLV